MNHKPNSIFEAAFEVLTEAKQKTVKSLVVGDKVIPRNGNDPKTLKQKIANRNNYFKLVFDDGSDTILHGTEIFKLAESVIEEAADDKLKTIAKEIVAHLSVTDKLNDEILALNKQIDAQYRLKTQAANDAAEKLLSKESVLQKKLEALERKEEPLYNKFYDTLKVVDPEAYKKTKGANSDLLKIAKKLTESVIDEAKKPVSLEDPVWDASFDGKSIDTNLTWSEIVRVATSRKPGSRVISDTFTVMDLKSGEHKSIIFSAGAKGSIRVRVQLHPMNKKLLAKTPDSFGTVK